MSRCTESKVPSCARWLRRAPQLTSLYVNETRPITRTSISGRAIIERTTIHVPDHQAAEAAREYPDARRDTGIRTTIGIPLLRDGIAIGAFTAYRTESRPFAEHEIALLRTFADQAAIAIENVRLFTELQGIHLSSSASGTPRALASLRNVLSRGSCIPTSKRERQPRETSAFTASLCWVRPRLRLNFRSFSKSFRCVHTARERRP